MEYSLRSGAYDYCDILLAKAPATQRTDTHAAMTVPYQRAPIVEVSLSVQFNSLKGFLSPHAGKVWAAFEKEFPKIEQYPALAATIEQTDVAPSGQIVGSMGAPTPRIWMINNSRTELIQLQPDRFIRNWRNYADATGNLPYPNYGALKDSFSRDQKKFFETLVELDLPEPQINQYELNYVNWVRQSGVWENHGDIHKVLRHWNSGFADSFKGEFESAAFQITKRIELNGKFIARLYFSVTPMKVPGQNGMEHIYQTSTIVRGFTEGPIMDFFDMAHDNVIDVFENVFSKELQAAWGRGQ